jgi:hypothetical protein
LKGQWPLTVVIALWQCGLEQPQCKTAEPWCMAHCVPLQYCGNGQTQEAWQCSVLETLIDVEVQHGSTKICIGSAQHRQPEAQVADNQLLHRPMVQSLKTAKLSKVAKRCSLATSRGRFEMTKGKYTHKTCMLPRHASYSTCFRATVKLLQHCACHFRI